MENLRLAFIYVLKLSLGYLRSQEQCLSAVPQSACGKATQEPRAAAEARS